MKPSSTEEKNYAMQLHEKFMQKWAGRINAAEGETWEELVTELDADALELTQKQVVELKEYGGQGYSYSEEDGLYEVRTESGIIKKFTKLSEARAYFDSLNEGKGIWDMTTIPELLDAYTT